MIPWSATLPVSVEMLTVKSPKAVKGSSLSIFWITISNLIFIILSFICIHCTSIIFISLHWRLIQQYVHMYVYTTVECFPYIKNSLWIISLQLRIPSDDIPTTWNHYELYLFHQESIQIIFPKHRIPMISTQHKIPANDIPTSSESYKISDNFPNSYIISISFSIQANVSSL